LQFDKHNYSSNGMAQSFVELSWAPVLARPSLPAVTLLVREPVRDALVFPITVLIFRRH
jgi:hypothetical protein